MKPFLMLFLLAIYACQSTTSIEDTPPYIYQSFQWLEDSILVWRIEWEEKRETRVWDEMERDLILFLGLLPPKTAVLQKEDTLITLKHDYSFAGFIGAKYTQILKTATSIQLVEAAYDNYTDENDPGREGFVFNNPLVGMDLGKAYLVHFQQKDLTTIQWQNLITQLKDSHFLKIKQEDCGSIVLDGTFTYAVFHSFGYAHKVIRHNCPASSFYRLAQQIDSLSPNPISIKF